MNDAAKFDLSWNPEACEPEGYNTMVGVAGGEAGYNTMVGVPGETCEPEGYNTMVGVARGEGVARGGGGRAAGLHGRCG